MSYVSTSVSSLVVGDYIGMESGVDLAPSYSGVDGLYALPEREAGARPPLPATRVEVEKCRSFPPPIPSLAQTENQQPHMPWVMRRYYSGDGRLVIREERVRHHDYFTAHRSNGRLTLRLVPLDDDFDSDSASDSSSGEKDDCGNLDGGEGTGGRDSPAAAKLAATETPSASVEFGPGTGKCSEYDGMVSSACSFRMPVMVLRPVLG